MGCNVFCQAVAGVNWWWFAAAVVVCFALGALWYSVLFQRTWVRVFRVEMGEVTPGGMVRTFATQIAASVVYGFAIFVLTGISAWVSLLAIVGFCAWEKGNLGFEFSRWNDFFMACLIRAGYTFLAGVIFLLFALI